MTFDCRQLNKNSRKHDLTIIITIKTLLEEAVVVQLIVIILRTNETDFELTILNFKSIR